ncbi:Glycogen synthase [Chitinispirillum alkaliphilum]|nr:Glycogen synthase [Chitinispirillum alkaliphilum]
MRSGFYEYFSQLEIDTLSRSERTFQDKRRQVIFLSFENKYAKLGGLAAVMGLLPSQLLNSGEKTILVTPFYKNNSRVKTALDEGAFETLFENEKLDICNFKGVLSCYRDTTSVLPCYYIDVENYFTAVDDPYSYRDNEKLVLDALVFSAAVPVVLNRVGIKDSLIFHAHDWETAPIAITSKMAVLSGVLDNARTVLTLHNSFDGAISAVHKKRFFGKEFPGHTILQCVMPLLNGPLTTVSAPFAYELKYDPLQRTVFTNHLQDYFSMNTPIGIENGMFGNPAHPFTSKAESNAVKGDFSLLLKEKNKFRNELEEIVQGEKNPEIIGKLDLSCADEDVPVFFMSGRLDLMQKGFDVIFQAISRLPKGKIKLFFCPSCSDNGSRKELALFEKIQKKLEGDITIWPFRVPTENYRAILKGASFLVMPSFYEPFGAATEGFLHGTPVLARATGGLWVQVNPYNGIHVPRFYKSLFDFSGSIDNATGILYREKCDEKTAGQGWVECLKLAPGDRIKNKFYRSMINAAEKSLITALDLYSDKESYGKMIYNGLKSLELFSWDQAIEKYRTIYDTASSRGVF